MSHLCGCGRIARYTVGKDENGNPIESCNKYKRCDQPEQYGEEGGRLTKIFDEITAELIHADQKYAHDPMATAELGLATIKCELAELEREVLRPHRNESWMRKEAVQTAAMCIKMLRDVCK